jgi:hypothetical protein
MTNNVVASNNSLVCQRKTMRIVIKKQKQQFRIQARISKKMDMYEARIKSAAKGEAPPAGDPTRSEE